MPPQITTVPAWKRQLYVNKAHALLALDTEDFSYFQIRHALSAQADMPTEQEFVLQGGDSSAAEDLKDLNIGNATENETAFAQYQADTEDLKGETDQQVWKQKMEERKNAAKERVVAAIDATYDAAADIINQLPLSSQESAFNIFDAGQQWVMNAFQILVDQMKVVIGHIVDFIKGVWTAMKAAWTTVKNAVGTAINFIKGIFSAESFGYSNIINNRDIKGDNTIDVDLILSWSNSPPVPGAQVAASVEYLHNSVENRLHNQYFVHITEPARSADGQTWAANIIIKQVDYAKVSDVLVATTAVVCDEAKRTSELPSWPEVPTPDPVSVGNSPCLSGTSGRGGRARRAGKSGGQLPKTLALRAQQATNRH